METRNASHGADQPTSGETGKAVSILRLYVSAGHNYFGHHGQEPGENEVVEQTEITCVAGRGIEGDRFFDYKPDYKGQITFFAEEVYEQIRDSFSVHEKSPAVLRRNVITRGIDLN